MSKVIAKNFEKKCIGKFVSNSKEELIWKVEIEGILNTVTLKLSHLSRKFEVFVNGISKKIGTEVFGSINYEFKHMLCLFIIESDFKKTTLKINGTLFKNLYYKNDANFYRPSQNQRPSFQMRKSYIIFF